MYRGFNLNLRNADFSNESYKLGTKLHSELKERVKKTLDSFTAADGKLLASKMQANWFPQIECDVFISHSHEDEKHAISLAGWLKNKFGLTSFVDSCAWGYSDDLLSLIDDEFCYNKQNNTYIYKRRNRSTSHVHMMLSTALSMMLDKAECVFFLNTPSSITPNEVIDDSSGTTKSPWIYSEIAMTRLIRKRSIDEHRGLIKKSMAETLRQSMDFLYEIKVDHLTDLDTDDMLAWEKQKTTHSHPLDALYAMK